MNADSGEAPRLYIVAGERSGDRHGAGLLRELLTRRNLRVSGLGGPEMRLEAPGIEDWVEEAGVVGLWEVLKKYGYFKRKFAATLDQILTEKPAAVILVDYPGFNLRLAEALRRESYSGKIVYYISPQVWAWKKGRVPRMAKALDLMICLFPFEPEIYRPFDLKAVFSGHPLADERPPAEETRNPEVAGLFPGSRTMEIKRLYPLMLDAAELLLKKHPGWRFRTPAAGPRAEELIRSFLAEAAPEVRAAVEVKAGAAREMMRNCRAALVASGTATLEASCHGLVYALVYRVHWLTYAVGKMVLTIPFLGMANILAERAVVKELIQGQCTAESMAGELESLMTDEPRRAQIRAGLAEAVAKLGGGGAYANAAEAALAEMGIAPSRTGHGS